MSRGWGEDRSTGYIRILVDFDVLFLWLGVKEKKETSTRYTWELIDLDDWALMKR